MVDYADQAADLMIAVHAWRSAGSIARFRELFPGRPLIVALSGTDLNDYLHSDPAPTLRSLRLADRLIVLNREALKAVPPPFRRKARVVHQSAEPVRRRRPSSRNFEVAVIGHLREVKDPLRAALAARGLPPRSRIHILHVGAAHTPDWAAKAKAEMAQNPRYVWRGDVPRAAVRALLARSRAMVLSSLSEGGANVISEAVVAGVPVLASRIAGSIGLLGRGYPGYFAVGDTEALTRLLQRIESDPAFLGRLATKVRSLRPMFTPARERTAWRRLLAELPARSARARRSAAKRGR